MVRAHGRALLRHVVGVGGTSADGAGGNRAPAPPPAAWPERPCVRLGERSLRKAMESGALRMSEGTKDDDPIQSLLAQRHVVGAAGYGHLHRHRRRVAALADVALT